MQIKQGLSQSVRYFKSFQAMSCGLPKILFELTGIRGVQLPSRNTLANSVQTSSLLVQRDAAAVLKSAECFVLAADASGRQNKKLFAVEASVYSDSKQEPVKFLLSLLDLHHDERACSMAEATAWLMSELDLPAEKLVMFLSDNTTSMSGMGSTGGMVKQLGEILEASIDRIPCALHVLQIAVTRLHKGIFGAKPPRGAAGRALPHQQNIFMDCWQLAGDSTPVFAELHEAARQQNISLKRCPKPVDTRWFYVLLTLKWVLDNRSNLFALDAQLGLAKRPLHTSPKWRRIIGALQDSIFVAKLRIVEGISDEVLLPFHKACLSQDRVGMLTSGRRLPAGFDAHLMARRFLRLDDQLKSAAWRACEITQQAFAKDAVRESAIVPEVRLHMLELQG